MTNWHSTPQQAPSDANLLARLAEVKEDGEIWGPNASNVTTCVEDRSLYQKIRDAVHDQYRPRTAYQQILADRIAETIWRAERYASFETTALSFQISLNWKKFEDSPVKPTISAHDWFAWLSLEGPAYKALLEALKLEDRSWRRHRALCAELRTVQKTVRDEITPRNGPTPVPFTPDPADGRGPDTESENEPNVTLTPAIPETTAEGAATVTERIPTNEPTGPPCSTGDNPSRRTQPPPTACTPSEPRLIGNPTMARRAARAEERRRQSAMGASRLWGRLQRGPSAPLRPAGNFQRSGRHRTNPLNPTRERPSPLGAPMPPPRAIFQNRPILRAPAGH